VEYIRAYLRLHPLLAKDAELKRTWLTRLEQHFADALSAEDPTLYSGLSEVLTRHRKELKQTFNEINERVIARAAQWMRAVPRQSGDHRPVEQIIGCSI
jgi:DNA-binding MurR/RpiR family transcriptional regulator